nr:Ltp family lipoprotein [Sphingomonas mali]
MTRETPSKASSAPAGADPAPITGEESASLAGVGLFGPRANAARSARQYLDMTGFSRRGLIEQLSSDAGNGYDVADATAAVDSLNVDWNEQAVRSAKQYLSMSGFSCSGLIDQLSSDAGSKYTEAQARYGAEQAGAC